MRFAVVADDLSGAAEVASLARERGFRVELTRMQPPSADAEVWVCDTDTRDHSFESAETRISQVADWLLELEAPPVFKKIDSVLRGHPAMESHALAGRLHRSLWIAPGNPSIHRVVRKGQLLINDIPLHQTAFALEEGGQSTTSDVRMVWGVPDAVPSAVWVEAQTEEELGKKLSGSGEALLAGARDAFLAWPPAQSKRAAESILPTVEAPRSLLFVCGSKTGWPDREALALEKGWPVHVLENLPEELPATGVVGFGAQPARPPRDEELAAAVAVRLHSHPPLEMAAEGGATASALFQAMGWERFEVLATGERGVAVVRPAGWPGRVWIKPGSYPWPQSVLLRLPDCAGENQLGG